MIRPRHKRILVELIDDENPSDVIEVVTFDKYNQKSTGLNGKAKTRGKVLAVAEDCDHDNGVNIGEIIRFTVNGGLPVKDDGRDRILLHEKDVMFVEG